MSAEQIELATRLLANGYLPVPILRHDAPPSSSATARRSSSRPASSRTAACGPQGHRGLQRHAATIAGWRRLHDIGDYPGLGIACGTVVAVDVDVYEPELAAGDRGAGGRSTWATHRCAGSARRRRRCCSTGPTGSRSQGQTAEFLKDDLKAQVEVLGQGQQVVGYGIHPATGAPYTWARPRPRRCPLAELPAVTQEQVDGARAPRRRRGCGRPATGPRRRSRPAHGGAAARPPERHQERQRRQPVPRRQRRAPLRTPERWVPALFGPAPSCDARGVWRVPSSALGPRPRGGHQHLARRHRRLRRARHGRPEARQADRHRPRHRARRRRRRASRRPVAGRPARHRGARSGARKRSGRARAEDECDRWNEQLHRTDRGEARDIIHNVALILRTDDRFKGRLRWNEMLEAVEASDLPWRRATTGGQWTDADDL